MFLWCIWVTESSTPTQSRTGPPPSYPCRPTHAPKSPLSASLVPCVSGLGMSWKQRLHQNIALVRFDIREPLELDTGKGQIHLEKYKSSRPHRLPLPGKIEPIVRICNSITPLCCFLVPNAKTLLLIFPRHEVDKTVCIALLEIARCTQFVGSGLIASKDFHQSFASFLEIAPNLLTRV